MRPEFYTVWPAPGISLCQGSAHGENAGTAARRVYQAIKLPTSCRPLYQHCTASLAGCDTIARAARIWFQIADHLRAATSEKQDESRPAAMRANPLPRIHHLRHKSTPRWKNSHSVCPNPLPRIHHSATRSNPNRLARKRSVPIPYREGWTSQLTGYAQT